MPARAVSVGQMLRVLAVHELMLADRKRNRALERALARTVARGSHVLDLGAGTGVWAVSAARLGAARVVAIEREPLLAPVIHQLARDNGVADRVEVVVGDSRRVSVSGRFDLVVTETIGAEAFEEGIVALLDDARRRFLEPGGRVVPRSLALMAAPVATELAGPSGLAIRTPGLEALLANVPRRARAAVRKLAPACALLRADFVEPRRFRPARELHASWPLRDVGRLSAVALWARAELAPGVRLDTLRGTHWPPTLLPVGPFGARRGRLSFTLSRTGRVRRWRASLRSASGVEEQDASALLAYGALRGPLEEGR